MSRTLYKGLLRLHPLSFREEFEGEMLWIYDQAAAADGAFGLFADAAVSLLRQWVLGRGTWKVAAAFIGGLLYMALACSLIVPRHLPSFPAADSADAGYSALAWPNEPGR